MFLFPPVSVQITGSMTTPTIGRSLTLTCGTSGTEGLNITNYHWKKDGILLSDEVGPTLSFAFLRLSDVGQYTCEVTINNNVMKYSDTEDINLTSNYGKLSILV